MRASRLVSILLLLQTRGQMSASELADRLEVSVRTIYRDLQALSEAGVPIYTEPGPRGGCRLVEGYRTRLTGLTPEEAEVMLLSGLPGAIGELGLGTTLAAAQLKMLAALPDELRERASLTSQRFHLDAPGWFRSNVDLPHLATIAGAVWDDRQVRLSYQPPRQEPAWRVIEPLGLVLKAGVWYLVGRNPEREEPHSYRVSRVRAVEPLDERFERPADFGLGEFWGRATREFEASRPRVAVALRLSPDAQARAAWLVGDAPHQPDDEDGWARVEVGFESLSWAEEELLGVGAGVEVLAPAELRERMTRTAWDLAERYGRPR